MQTVVKKWFRDKGYGFLDNGDGSDIIVRKDDLVGCHFLKVGVTVSFECFCDKHGLAAKKVKLSSLSRQPCERSPSVSKEHYFGVMR
ncbi:MAG: hypothetical protein COA42_10750 [Alteromonadaceae bacterium]|nr:MAG: hypothetical protein COA42_10750 [Alteromonadaceae bacterium]